MTKESIHEYKAPFLRDLNSVLERLRDYANRIDGYKESAEYVSQLDTIAKDFENRKKPLLTRNEYKSVRNVMTKQEILERYNTTPHQIGAYEGRITRKKVYHKQPLTREIFDEVKGTLSEDQIMKTYRTSPSQIAAYRTWDNVHSKKKKHRK